MHRRRMLLLATMLALPQSTLSTCLMHSLFFPDVHLTSNNMHYLHVTVDAHIPSRAHALLANSTSEEVTASQMSFMVVALWGFRSWMLLEGVDVGG